jgi:predicted TPR repeat methyltransferase
LSQKAKEQPSTKSTTNQQFFDNFWNENMIKYLSQSAGSRWFKYLLSEILKETDPKTVKSVADIGCGVGTKTVILANYFKKAKVIGTDFAAEAIAASNKTFHYTNLSFAVVDITKSKDNKKYDVITAFDVLEHIKDWKKLVRSIIASNNKYIVFSFPVGRMRPYEVNIGHYRNFKRNEMEDFMASAGYKTVKTFYAGFPFYSPILRDLTNAFFKNYEQTPQKKMTFLSRIFHNIWYFLFRYLSSKRHGDIFIGLFEKTNDEK